MIKWLGFHSKKQGSPKQNMTVESPDMEQTTLYTVGMIRVRNDELHDFWQALATFNGNPFEWCQAAMERGRWQIDVIASLPPIKHGNFEHPPFIDGFQFSLW